MAPISPETKKKLTFVFLAIKLLYIVYFPKEYVLKT